MTEIESSGEAGTHFTRRELLRNTLSAVALSPLLKPARGFAAGARNRPIFAYVGTYSSPVDGGGNGKGIYLYEMNPVSGELKLIKLAAAANNASWLAFDPSRRYLYAANEVAGFVGRNGSVSAYTVDRKHGDLQLLNTVSSEGASPAHLSVDATGKHVFVANYVGGNIAVLPILPTGALGAATYVHQDTGSIGPTIPSSGPSGSFAFSGHDKPHAHMIHVDPSNHFVVQTDLGQDRIYVFALDQAAGKLSPASMPFVSMPAGDGPRHFIFQGNGRWMYSLQEEASTVVFFHFDPATGALEAQQTLSVLPPNFQGTSFASEILLSPDGRYLYAANRLHDTIAIFALDHEGRMRRLGETPTMGDYPRHMQMDPTGAFLYVANQRSDSIASFRVNQETGQLTFTGQYTGVGSPACILFLA